MTMSMRSLALLLCTGTALAAAPARAADHIVDIRWTEGRFVHAATVPPGKFVEVCGRLDLGAKVRWRFEASGPMDFNIHYHVGKAVEYPAKQAQVARGEDTVQVSVPEDYCWMWSNKSAQRTTLNLQLQR